MLLSVPRAFLIFLFANIYWCVSLTYFIQITFDLLVLMCVRPLNIKVTSRTFGVTRYVSAPCGNCVECLKRRQNDWKLRLVHESQYWNNLYFFTLTYANHSLPCRVDYCDVLGDSLFEGSFNDCVAFCNGDSDLFIRSSACKHEIQNFLKSMREDVSRKLGSRMEMKYFICAEYGPNPNGTKRPHYHGVIMTNVSYNMLLPYFNAWGDFKGRMEFKQVGLGRQEKSKVANYISKYCAKGCFESRQEDISLGLIEKAWYIMSKGIGERWLEDNRGYWEKYVPTCLSIEGDFTLEDVERFFSVRDISERSDLISKFYPKYLGRDDVLENLRFRSERANMCFEEINSLIDNFFVFDGDLFKYKMPRFYRERMLCVQKTYDNVEILKSNGKPVYDLRLCESKLPTFSEKFNRYDGCKAFALAYSPQPITYKSRIRKDKRYVSENFLSVAFAYCLSLRVLNSYQKEFDAVKQSNPLLSDIEVDSLLYDKREVSKYYRELNATSQMRNFYNNNMWNHREFDE